MWWKEHPKLVQITKKEYLKAAKKYTPKTFDLEKSLWASKENFGEFIEWAVSEIYFHEWYIKEPIYEDGSNGIMAQINRIDTKEKPIKYKYYKKVGTERIWFVNQKEADIIHKHHLNLNNADDIVKFYKEYNKLVECERKTNSKKKKYL